MDHGVLGRLRLAVVDLGRYHNHNVFGNLRVAVGVSAAFANHKTCYRYIIDRHRGDLVAGIGRKHHISAGLVVLHRGLVTIGHRTMPDDRTGHAVGAQLPLGHQRDAFIKNLKRRIHDTIISHPAGEVVVVLGRHVAGHGNGCTRGIVEPREIALRLASSKIINDRVACNRPARRGSDHVLIQHHLCRRHVPVRVGRNLGTHTANSAGHNGDLDDQLLALCTVYIVFRVIVAGHANGFAFNAGRHIIRSLHCLVPAVPVPICGIDFNGTHRVRISEGEILGKRIDHRGRIIQRRIRRRGNVLTDRRKDAVQLLGTGRGLVILAGIAAASCHIPAVYKPPQPICFNLCFSIRVVGRGGAHVCVDILTVCTIEHADRIDRSVASLHAFCRVNDLYCNTIVKSAIVVGLAVREHDNDLRVRGRLERRICQLHAVVGRRCAACPQAVNGSFKRFCLSHRSQSHNDLSMVIAISTLLIRIVSNLVRHLSGKLHNGNIAFRRVFRNAFNEAVDGGFQRIDLFLVRPCKRIVHRAGNVQHEGDVERLRFFLRGRFAGRPCFHGDGIGPIFIDSGILGKHHSGVRRQGADGQQTERHHARHQHCHQSPFHFIHSLHLNLSIPPEGRPLR